MRKRYIVYGLMDPDHKELRYIGKSSSGKRRAEQHWSPYYLNREKNTRKSNWIKNVLGRGKFPLVIILHEGKTEAEVSEIEIEFISYFRSLGCNLANVLSGGDGFTAETARAAYYCRTPESRAISKQNMLRGAISTNVRGRNNLRLRKPVLATNKVTGECRWYLSASHASSDGLGSRSAISNCLRPGWRCKSNKSWTFEFVAK